MPRIHYPAVLSIRLTESQAATVRAAATAAAMSISRYGRHRLLGHPVRAFVDDATLREMRRIGGLIRHAYDTITATGDPDVQRRAQHEARDALRALTAAADRLGQPP